jgi:ClpP class serine protease
MALDPFSPENPEEIERLKAIQRDVHQAFTGLVRERRGSKLKGSDETLFSGEFWSGPKAAELGLIDGLVDLRTKMRELFGDKVRLPLISFERGWLRRRLAFSRLQAVAAASGLGPRWGDELLSTLEERALWARFGL